KLRAGMTALRGFREPGHGRRFVLLTAFARRELVGDRDLGVECPGLGRNGIPMQRIGGVLPGTARPGIKGADLAASRGVAEPGSGAQERLGTRRIPGNPVTA